MFFYSRFIFIKSTFFIDISFVWIVLNSIKSEVPCPYSNRRITDGFQPSVLPFFTWNTMFLLHVMPCIWWGEGITSFALWQAKTVVIQEMMLSPNGKIIKKNRKEKKRASSYVNKQKAMSVVGKKINCDYWKLCSVSLSTADICAELSCMTLCSTSHVQVAFKQGWNGIWARNPLGTVCRKKNLCSQISKSLPVGNPIPNRKIRTKAKQQKLKVYSFLTSEVFPTWSPFTCVHQQLEIHSCLMSFQNNYKCRNVSCCGNYTHCIIMIKYDKLPP